MKRRSRPYRNDYRMIHVPGGRGFPSYITSVSLRDPNKSLWGSIKDFINRKRKDKFTYGELIKSIYEVGREDFYSATINTYLEYLCSVKILERINCNSFIKHRNIPKQLTTTLLRKLANKTTWESWFIPLDMVDELYGDKK